MKKSDFFYQRKEEKRKTKVTLKRNMRSNPIILLISTSFETRASDVIVLFFVKFNKLIIFLIKVIVPCMIKFY
jgi:hypothetical protein